MRRILAVVGLVQCGCERGRRRRAVARADRLRQGAGRGRRLRGLPHRRSRKTVRGRQAHRHAVRRDLCAEPDAGPRHRDRRLAGCRFHPRGAHRHRAGRLALLPGLPLPLFHADDQGRHAGDPRLSRHARAGREPQQAAGAALAVRLSRPDAGLELAVLHSPACSSRTRARARRGTEAAISSPGSAIAVPATRRRTILARTRPRRRCRAASSAAGTRRGSMAPRAPGCSRGASRTSPNICRAAATPRAMPAGRWPR